MSKPTHQDAMLMLQIAQWSTSGGLGDASNWMWSDQFITDFAEFVKRYPSGSEGNRNAAKICSYFETLGVLWKHKLLNEDLLFDWVKAHQVWRRINPYALGMRQATGNPRVYENFEALANANVAHDAKTAKRTAKRKNPKE